MTTGRPFPPGESGNPKGRPKKDRALTAMLEAAGARTVDAEDGRASLRKLAIQGVWEAVTEGRVRFRSGAEMPLYSKDYVELVKFLFTHIDGPAKTVVEQRGDPDAPLTIRVIYDDADDSSEG